MHTTKHIGLSACIISSFILSACSSQPNSQNQALELGLNQHTQWQVPQTNAAQVSQLTDLVSVTGVNALISEALLNNPSYQQMQVALKLAQAQRKVAAASQWFTVDAGFNAERSEDSDTQYSSALTVSWEADVWQKISDTVSAQDMAIASSQADLQSAKDTLVATVMRNYLTLILNKNLLLIEQQRLTVLENNESSIVERYRYGIDDLEALDTAKSNTASTRATIAAYQELIAQTERALSLVIGRESLPEFASGDEFPEILQPLASLPKQDLARRPDLQSAYYTIQQTRYLVDVAYKDMLPSINLSASLTDMANTPSQALLASPVWSLLGGITAPLFQGGELKAQAEVAELNAEQAYWQYQETLLTAVNEVENALGQESSLNVQKQHIQNALNSAQRSVANYQKKYQQGLVDLLDLLTVQQQVYDLQAQLIQINYNLLTNRIDLGLALGLGVSA